NEEPNLTKDKWRAQENRRKKSQLEFKVERLGRTGNDHFYAGLADRPRNCSEEGNLKAPADAESNGNGNEAMEDALAKFLEMVEERHLSSQFFLFVLLGI